MGSDDSYFNVSVGSDGQSHKTVSTNHNLFEEKREPKRYRTEVRPLTSLTPYRWAKAAHSYLCDGLRFIYIHTLPYHLCDCLQLTAYTPFSTLCTASDTPVRQGPRTRLSTVGSLAFQAPLHRLNDLPFLSHHSSGAV